MIIEKNKIITIWYIINNHFTIKLAMFREPIIYSFSKKADGSPSWAIIYNSGRKWSGVGADYLDPSRVL